MNSIRSKLLLVITMVVFIVVLIIMLLMISINRQYVIDNTYDRLRALREIKSDQIVDYIEISRNQVRTMSEDFMVVEAMKGFRAAFHTFDNEDVYRGLDKTDIERGLNEHYGDNFLPQLAPNIDGQVFASNYIPANPITRAMQFLYIADNPNPVGEKQKLNVLENDSEYSGVHETYHPKFLSFLEKFGYYDFFLVDSKTGHVVYSVYKEVDFATSLLNGPYGTTSIAKLFREASQATFADFVRMVDFEPYVPSYNAPASFIASPIFDGEENIGVLIFQMPVDRINHIMTYDNNWEEVGLGKSGETYIVAQDFTLRNQSRFLIESKVNYLKAISDSGVDGKVVDKISNFNSAIGLQPVRTEGSIEAVNGMSGEAIFEDYRGVRVLSSYAPIDLEDLEWSLMSEIDLHEAKIPLRRMRLTGLLVFLTMIPLGALLGLLFSRSITRRLKSMKKAALQLADGDLSVKIKSSGQDEISSLASSFEKMRTAINDLVEDQKKTIDALSASLVPVTDDVAVMVLIGTFDEHRVAVARENLMQALHKEFYEIVIIDVTNIPHLDESSGKGLTNIAKAARLMGCQVIISGINSEMAIELTNLSVDVSGLNTQNTLRNAIQEATELITKKGT